MGRAGFYLSRARKELQTHGLGGMLATAWVFLKRRRFFFQFILEWFEYHYTSKQRSMEATLIRVLKSEPLTSAKIMIYASYDPQSQILPHVVQQVSYFKSVGYQLVWVSTSPEIPTIEFAKVQPLVDVALHRKNEGYDFASWALGYQYVAGASPTSLIVMNDSCLGPQFDFTPLLKKIEAEQNAVYGITKSYEIGEYIQSYFIHFGRNLLKTEVVGKYFARIRILNSKWGIVRFFEIGGSQFLKNEGTAIKALVDPKESEIAKVLNKFQVSDPVPDPAGTEWIKRELSPFYKRSNLVQRFNEPRKY